MFEKEIAEVALELKNEDLKRLEEYEKAHEASKNVEDYIRSIMSKRKNRELVDSYRRILNVVELDDGGRLACICEIRDRLESDYYETRARNMVWNYRIKLFKELEAQS